MANVDLKTPSEIAAQFAKFYYEKFDQNRAELAQLYVSLFFYLYLLVLFFYYK